jgi:hypothetical protein
MTTNGNSTTADERLQRNWQRMAAYLKEQADATRRRAEDYKEGGDFLMSSMHCAEENAYLKALAVWEGMDAAMREACQ